MSINVLFALCFGASPALFFIGWRFRDMPMIHCLFAALFAACGMALSGVGAGWSALASFALIWLGWICVLVAGTALLEETVFKTRISRTIGAVGATTPWFGFASAQFLTG